jgi:methylthioribose-1-phosphate isomerase
MLISGTPTRTLWREMPHAVCIIDQTRLPHEFVLRRLTTLDDAAEAISVMRVRGAPLIGATAAYGLALAALRQAVDDGVARGGRTVDRDAADGGESALGGAARVGALAAAAGCNDV